RHGVDSKRDDGAGTETYDLVRARVRLRRDGQEELPREDRQDDSAQAECECHVGEHAASKRPLARLVTFVPLEHQQRPGELNPRDGQEKEVGELDTYGVDPEFRKG